MELIFLTYSLLLSYYNRLALTCLSMSIGNFILFHIFKKRMYSDQLRNKENIDKLISAQNTGKVSNNSNGDSSYLKFNDFKEIIEFEDKKTVKLGDFFISIFCQFPSNVFEREHSIDSYYNKTGIKLKINPVFLKLKIIL